MFVLCTEWPQPPDLLYDIAWRAALVFEVVRRSRVPGTLMVGIPCGSRTLGSRLFTIPMNLHFGVQPIPSRPRPTSSATSDGPGKRLSRQTACTFASLCLQKASPSEVDPLCTLKYQGIGTKVLIKCRGGKGEGIHCEGSARELGQQ